MLILCISVLILGAMYWFNYDKNKQKKRTDQNYQSQVQMNLEAAKALNILKKYYDVYRGFVEKGVIGRTERLQHFELIQALGNQLEIPSVLFSIESNQYATSGNYYIWDEIVHLQYSVMHLNLTLIHEGQFQQFMDGLNDNVKGVSSMQRCRLTKAEEQNAVLEYGELSAICELHWYSLKDITQSWSDNDLVQN